MFAETANREKETNVVPCIRSIDISYITRRLNTSAAVFSRAGGNEVRSLDSISHIAGSSVDERKLLQGCYTCAAAFDCLATLT